MYIKNRNQFIKESDDKSPGENLQFQLREFNTRKNNLKNLILNNVDSDTDKDISKNYEDIVGQNQFLSSYGNILKLQASIIKNENRIEDITEEINKLNKDKSLVSQMSDDEDKESKTSEIDESIKSKQDQINDIKESTKEIESKIKTMEKGLKDFIRDKTQELNDIKRNSMFP